MPCYMLAAIFAAVYCRLRCVDAVMLLPPPPFSPLHAPCFSSALSIFRYCYYALRLLMLFTPAITNSEYFRRFHCRVDMPRCGALLRSITFCRPCYARYAIRRFRRRFASLRLRRCQPTLLPLMPRVAMPCCHALLLITLLFAHMLR